MKKILVLCFMVALLFAQQQSIKEGITGLNNSLQATFASLLFLLMVPMAILALAGAAVFFIAKSERNRKIGKYAAIAGVVVLVVLLLLYVLVPMLIGSMMGSY